MKTLLILFPYKFTEFYYHKYELMHIKKKNYEVIVHDLADINTNSKFIKSIKTKTKVNRQVIRFSSLISWIKAFNKIRKTKNVLVYNMVDEASFNIFIIKLFLKLSNVTIVEYRVIDIPEWIRRKKSLKDYFRSILKQKRKLLNLSFFLFRVREFFFLKLIKLIKFNKIIFLVNKKTNKFKKKNNISLINFSQCDYSTSLLEKKGGINKKRYIVYLDTPPPYFLGDALYDGKKPAKNNVEMWYNELNSFFDYIENLFKARVIIIPHHKYKIPRLKKKNLNPYFKKRVSDNSYNACEKLIPGCLFIVNKGSSALAHAITHYKPIQHIYSSNYLYEEHQMKDLLLHSKLSGGKIINIASINKKELINNVKVNKKKYNLYKYKYLTYKNSEPMKFNHEILRGLLDGISLKK